VEDVDLHAWFLIRPRAGKGRFWRGKKRNRFRWLRQLGKTEFALCIVREDCILSEAGWQTHLTAAIDSSKLTHNHPFLRRHPMRPPHWLDSVIGDLREVDDIALAIAESQKLRQAIQQGVDAAFAWEGLNEHDPKRLGSSFAQEIRVAIVEAIKKEH